VGELPDELSEPRWLVQGDERVAVVHFGQLSLREQQRIWAYHDGVDLGGPAMARIARDYGYTLAELRKL
jgi:hypothetical protein